MSGRRSRVTVDNDYVPEVSTRLSRNKRKPGSELQVFVKQVKSESTSKQATRNEPTSYQDDYITPEEALENIRQLGQIHWKGKVGDFLITCEY